MAILALEDANNEACVGGKARNLSRLIQLGVAVPPGFVLTTNAFEAFLDSHDRRAGIARVWRNAASETRPSQVRGVAEAIAAICLEQPLPDSLRDALDVHAAMLGASPLIVRSSAIGEDSGDASFAGQLDSIPDVWPGPALHEAIAGVWASRWSERALAYERLRKRPLRGMGVIVQRQITAAISGVLFTVASDDGDEMLVEYCNGRGQSLVSGEVNPGRLIVSRRALRVRHLAAPEEPLERSRARQLDRSLDSLGTVALQVEHAFGRPLDIEWTMDEAGATWIVQARPITTPLFGRAPAGVHAGTRNADACGIRARSNSNDSAAAPIPSVHWSNANVNENFPQPISPLLYSVASAGYYHYFRKLGRSFGISRRRLAQMEQPLRHIIGVHGARMYYNLTSIHAVLRSAPFGELLAGSFNQFVGSEETDTKPASAFGGRVRTHVAQALELCTIAAKTAWQYLFLTRRVRRFERTVAAFAERTRPDRLRERTLPELLDDFRGFLEIRCHRWNDAALADAASMVCYGVLQRALSRAFPCEDQETLHNSLLKALPDLVSGIPALKLWELGEIVRTDAELLRLFQSQPALAILDAVERDARFTRFREQFNTYLEQWGFRCSGELMLTVPSFQEDPAPLLNLIRTYATTTTESPGDVLRRQQAERLEQTRLVAAALRQRRLVPGIPGALQSAAVLLVLRGTQKSILLRERARLKQALLYSRLRRIVLAMGVRFVERGLVDHADDLFFLTVDEIDTLASGCAMFPAHTRHLVELRKRAHAELSAMTPPDTIALAAGEYLTSAPAQIASTDIDNAADELRGVGACGGIATARAAILTDVAESHRLSPGDVLVTRQTDPGWGAVFPLISGLVIERGGMLSHGAIIAREFGIPSVIGVRDATRRIPHGSRVQVDGNRGIVQLVGHLAAAD